MCLARLGMHLRLGFPSSLTSPVLTSVPRKMRCRRSPPVLAAAASYTWPPTLCPPSRLLTGSRGHRTRSAWYCISCTICATAVCAARASSSSPAMSAAVARCSHSMASSFERAPACARCSSHALKLLDCLTSASAAAMSRTARDHPRWGRQRASTSASPFLLVRYSGAASPERSRAAYTSVTLPSPPISSCLRPSPDRYHAASASSVAISFSSLLYATSHVSASAHFACACAHLSGCSAPAMVCRSTMPAAASRRSKVRPGRSQRLCAASSSCGGTSAAPSAPFDLACVLLGSSP